MDGGNEWKCVGGMYVHGSSWLNDVEGFAVDDENIKNGSNPSRKRAASSGGLVSGPVNIDQPGVKTNPREAKVPSEPALWSAKMDFLPGGQGMKRKRMKSSVAGNTVHTAAPQNSQGESQDRKVLKQNVTIQPLMVPGIAQGAATAKLPKKGLDPCHSGPKDVPCNVTTSGKTSLSNKKKRGTNRRREWHLRKIQEKNERKEKREAAQRQMKATPGHSSSQAGPTHLASSNNARSGSSNLGQGKSISPCNVTTPGKTSLANKRKTERREPWYIKRACVRKEKREAAQGQMKATSGHSSSQASPTHMASSINARSGSSKLGQGKSIFPAAAGRAPSSAIVRGGGPANPGLSSTTGNEPRPAADSAPKSAVRVRIRIRLCPLTVCNERVSRLRHHVFGHFPEYFGPQKTDSGDAFQRVLSLRVAALRYFALCLIGKGADEFGLVDMMNSSWQPGVPTLTEGDVKEMNAMIVQRNWPRVEPCLDPVNTPAALIHFRPLAFLVNLLTESQRNKLSISHEARPVTVRTVSQSEPQPDTSVPVTNKNQQQVPKSSESSHKTQSQPTTQAPQTSKQSHKFQPQPAPSALSGKKQTPKTASKSKTKSPQGQAPKPEQKTMKWVQKGSLMVLQNKPHPIKTPKQDSRPVQQNKPQPMAHAPPISDQFSQYGPRPVFHAPQNPGPVPQYGPQLVFNTQQNLGPVPQYGPRLLFQGQQNSGQFPQYNPQAMIQGQYNSGPMPPHHPQPMLHGQPISGPIPQYNPQPMFHNPQSSGPSLQYNPQQGFHTPQNTEPVPKHEPETAKKEQDSSPTRQSRQQTGKQVSKSSESDPRSHTRDRKSSRDSSPIDQSHHQTGKRGSKSSESDHRSHTHDRKSSRDSSPGKRVSKNSESDHRSHTRDSKSSGKAPRSELRQASKAPRDSERSPPRHSSERSVPRSEPREKVQVELEEAKPSSSDSSTSLKGFDSHYHLDRLRDAVERSMGHSNPLAPGREPDHVIEVVGGVRNFCDPETYSPLLDQLLMSYEEGSLWRYAVGIHPKKASVYTSEQWVLLLQYLSHPRVIALSKVGLDHSVPQDRWIDQELLLHRLLNVGVLGKVLVMHLQGGSNDRLGRDVHRTALNILREKCVVHQRIHIHSFSGDTQMLREWMDAFPHCYFGIAGRVKTFNREQRAAVDKIPSDRLLLETDAPHFAIHPELEYNTPLFLGDVGKLVADIRGQSLSKVMSRTLENGLRLYK